jgi:hypothetical protein
MSMIANVPMCTVADELAYNALDLDTRKLIARVWSDNIELEEEDKIVVRDVRVNPYAHT